MPTKAYGKFLSNMDTVIRLEDTFDEIRTNRNRRGRAAYDHITRSAIVFLASAFEVYIEDVTKECCNQHIVFSEQGRNLPHDVKDAINRHVKKESNATPPIELCDDGWKEVYRKLVDKETSKLNTPKKKQIGELFGNFLGIREQDLDNIPGINELDGVITFRGEIAHRVRAEQYVKIDQVKENVEIIRRLTIDIDKMILEYFKYCYPGKRLPWNSTY